MSKKIQVVVQKGGTCAEWYASSYDTCEDAMDAVQGHHDATYNSIGPFEVDLGEGSEGSWLKAMDDCLQAALTEDYANEGMTDSEDT